MTAARAAANTAHMAVASLLLSLVAAQAQTADAPARRSFAPDDFYRVQALSDPQV